MLFQINDQDRDRMGFLQLSGVLPANPSTIEHAVRKAGDIALDQMWEGNDPNQYFWNILTDNLAKLGWNAERVDIDVINL